MERFKNRQDAGIKLGKALSGYRRRGAIVLGIPRGGVEVAVAVAKVLGAPLDIVVAKKVPHPRNAEVAIAAVSHGGVFVPNPGFDFSEQELRVVRGRANPLVSFVDTRRSELAGGRPLLPLKGMTVILVDDGVATGSTVAAAAAFVRSQSPKKLVIATPVAPPDAVEFLRKQADEAVVLLQPPFFRAVGQFYESFPQVEDGQVKALLEGMKKKAG